MKDECKKLLLEIGMSTARAEEYASSLENVLKKRGIDISEQKKVTEIITEDLKKNASIRKSVKEVV